MAAAWEQEATVSLPLCSPDALPSASEAQTSAPNPQRGRNHMSRFWWPACVRSFYTNIPPLSDLCVPWSSLPAALMYNIKENQSTVFILFPNPPKPQWSGAAPPSWSLFFNNAVFNTEEFRMAEGTKVCTRVQFESYAHDLKVIPQT